MNLKSEIKYRLSMRRLARRWRGRAHQRSAVVPAHRCLTWTCHVCSEERPDDRIDVYQRRHMWPGGVIVTENIRYCNDRAKCRESASDIYWVSLEVEHAELEGEYRGVV